MYVFTITPNRIQIPGANIYQNFEEFKFDQGEQGRSNRTIKTRPIVFHLLLIYTKTPNIPFGAGF
jgi:hypothetical protein